MNTLFLVILFVAVYFLVAFVSVLPQFFLLRFLVRKLSDRCAKLDSQSQIFSSGIHLPVPNRLLKFTPHIATSTTSLPRVAIRNGTASKATASPTYTPMDIQLLVEERFDHRNWKYLKLTPGYFVWTFFYKHRVFLKRVHCLLKRLVGLPGFLGTPLTFESRELSRRFKKFLSSSDTAFGIVAISTPLRFVGLAIQTHADADNSWFDQFGCPRRDCHFFIGIEPFALHCKKNWINRLLMLEIIDHELQHFQQEWLSGVLRREWECDKNGTSLGDYWCFFCCELHAFLFGNVLTGYILIFALLFDFIFVHYLSGFATEALLQAVGIL